MKEPYKTRIEDLEDHVKFLGRGFTITFVIAVLALVFALMK